MRLVIDSIAGLGLQWWARDVITEAGVMRCRRRQSNACGLAGLYLLQPGALSAGLCLASPFLSIGASLTLSVSRLLSAVTCWAVSSHVCLLLLELRFGRLCHTHRVAPGLHCRPAVIWKRLCIVGKGWTHSV